MIQPSDDSLQLLYHQRMQQIMQDEDIYNELWTPSEWFPPLFRPDEDEDNSPHAKQPTRQEQRLFLMMSSHDHSKHERKWKDKYMQWKQQSSQSFSFVDYTDPDKYSYPDIPEQEPPPDYPFLRSMQEILQNWPQNEDYHFNDHNDIRIQEELMHFDYQTELHLAAKYRDMDLPFKLVRVPELLAANLKWTDDYLHQQFDVVRDDHYETQHSFFSWWRSKQEKTQSLEKKNDDDDDEDHTLDPPPENPTTTTIQASGACEVSSHNFFAFYTPNKFTTRAYGLPPTFHDSHMTFQEWAEHARYADAVQLPPSRPHYYWQAGVDRNERYDIQQQSFITKDLPSFSTTKNNFIVFDVEQQKGIQCRFGERQVVAATHYDTGRNMVGMITGAKRYILAPPNQCSRLGLHTQRSSPFFRHSLLNFGHMMDRHNKSNGMSDEEREWLERAATSQAVETVLKAGEILYIPSYWFHYIISLQKSAQCNVRSGASPEPHPQFGGLDDVQECKDNEW